MDRTPADFDAANPRHCKALIAAALVDLALPPYKLTARTIGFADLARRSMVFVSVHDWTPDPRWHELRELAVRHDFRVEGR